MVFDLLDFQLITEKTFELFSDTVKIEKCDDHTFFKKLIPYLNKIINLPASMKFLHPFLKNFTVIIYFRKNLLTPIFLNSR